MTDILYVVTDLVLSICVLAAILLFGRRRTSRVLLFLLAGEDW